MSAPRNAEEPVPSPFAGAGRKIDRGVARGLNRLTGTALAPYQSAVVRIGFALTFTLFLIREWPNRLDLYGTTSPWSFELAERLVASNKAFTVLLWSDGRLWAELVYHGAIVAGALLVLGWRTRTMSVLFMVGVLSIQNRSVFMGDGGDNVIHLMAMYLVLTRCGRVWSLDARRRARLRAPAQNPAGKGGAASDRTGVLLWAAAGLALFGTQITGFAELPWTDRVGTVPVPSWALVFWGMWAVHALWWWTGRLRSCEPRAVLDILTNVLHNGAMLVIVVEVCLIYATAGWYKIQGSRWQDGTALYYPLNLDYFAPWTVLSDLLGSNGFMVMAITYGTVIVQVAFPFTLFNRRVKNVLLAVMMTEHAAIAVVLGLPFFSLAMIAADAVFLPTGFLRWTGFLVSRGWRRVTAPPAGRGTGASGVAPAPADSASGPPGPPGPPGPLGPPGDGSSGARSTGGTGPGAGGSPPSGPFVPQARGSDTDVTL